MQELLKFKMCYGRPCVLVRWTGVSQRATLDNPTNCKDAIAGPPSNRRLVAPFPAQPECRRSRRSRATADAHSLVTGAAVAPLPILPTGFWRASLAGGQDARIAARAAAFKIFFMFKNILILM